MENKKEYLTEGANETVFKMLLFSDHNTITNIIPKVLFTRTDFLDSEAYVVIG